LSFGSVTPQISELRGVKNRLFPIQHTSLIQQLCATAHAVMNNVLKSQQSHDSETWKTFSMFFWHATSKKT